MRTWSKLVAAPSSVLLLLAVLLLQRESSGFVRPACPAQQHRRERSQSDAGATSVAATSVLTLLRRRTQPRLSPLRVVWSNPQETEDYFRRIEGKEEKDKTDQPSVIIGGGRLGKALAEWGGTGDDVIVGRGEALPDKIFGEGGKTTYDSFPIYVCVPEWEVESVIQACPKEKRNDLVFMQTACIENVLKRYGLCNKKMTQCTPYFSVSAIGRPLEGRVQYDTSKSDGEPKYAGQTSVCGKWRGAVAERLQKKDLSCLVLDYTYWRKFMLERLLFDAVFSIITTVHGGGKTYGELAQNHWEEIDDMVREMTRGIANTMAVVILTHVERRLRGLAEGQQWRDKKPSMPSARQYPFRNGFLRQISYTFIERGFRGVFPTHDEYLQFAEERGLIDYKIDQDI